MKLFFWKIVKSSSVTMFEIFILMLLFFFITILNPQFKNNEFYSDLSEKLFWGLDKRN